VADGHVVGTRDTEPEQTPGQFPSGLAALQASPEDVPRPRKLLSFVEEEPLSFEPGSRYEYSNSDNVTVGLMVEAITQRTCEGQLQEQVFGPLSLRRTFLPGGTNLQKPYIHGYDNDPSQQPPEDLSEVLASGWFWAAGGMVSTPADLNDFVRGYVGGELFDLRTRGRQVVEGGGPIRPALERTRRASGSFATGRCGATQEITPATPSSWRRVRMGTARLRCRSTSN
jgi:D-alanyl-D-alanine carboxypeptidase